MPLDALTFFSEFYKLDVVEADFDDAGYGNGVFRVGRVECKLAWYPALGFIRFSATGHYVTAPTQFSLSDGLSGEDNDEDFRFAILRRIHQAAQVPLIYAMAARGQHHVPGSAGRRAVELWNPNARTRTRKQLERLLPGIEARWYALRREPPCWTPPS